MNRRVVVTGVGLVTPLGIGVQESWQALCAGKSGVGEITRFDTSKFQTKIAAEVKGFRAEDFLPKKEAKRTERFIAYAIAAARMALEDSGLVIDDTNAKRIGVITGCGLGGLSILEDTCITLKHQRSEAGEPLFHSHDDRQHGSRHDFHPVWRQRTQCLHRYCLCCRCPCGGRFV